ncbi:MAG: fumarate hydratase [Clostridiales bacterium]|nr:fumarate hydratase [Clostridiales bacterium]
MKTIAASTVKDKVSRLITECLIVPDRAVTSALTSLETPNALEREAARLIAENNRIAEEKRLYCCQDTGQAVFFVRLGDEVYCKGLKDAITTAVREAYGNARKSVADPLTRENTHDNTPAIIEIESVGGDELEITFLAKGAGSENMSRLYMLTPADGKDGIVRSVVDAVERGGRNACPPLVVGVGIGGVTETACSLSKRALLRELGKNNEREDVAALEREILKKVNALGIGVAALGGTMTALAVNIETAPTHIGMLPVAVNLQCHSVRHGTVKL